MFKKFFVILVLVGSLVFSQEVPEKIKQDVQKRIKGMEVVKVSEPNLMPSLWINCCYDADSDCFKPLTDKGYIYSTDFTVYIYNSSNVQSSASQGKIEFIDAFSNRQKNFNFNVEPIPGKSFGKANPAKFSGPFLIKGDVKVSVTFQGSGIVKKTNTATYNQCSVLE